VATKCSSRRAENFSSGLNNAAEFVVVTPQKNKRSNSPKLVSNEMTVAKLLGFAPMFIDAATPCARLMPGKLVNN
jgi:hypothetical protein